MTDYAKPDSLPFRSYYAQQRRKKRKAANALVQRYITSLSAAGGMYYELSEPVVVTTDFEIEFKFTTTQDDFNFVSAENPAVNGVYIDMLDGKVRAFPYIGTTAPGSKLITTVNTYNDGSEQTCVLKVSANSAALTVGSESTAPVFWGLDLNQTISQLGLRGSTYSTGEIYDLKIWTGGDRNTGTLILDMPIDEDWTKGTVVHNRAAEIGAELWAGNSSATLVQDGSNTATLTDGVIELRGGYGRAYHLANIVAGNSYLIEVDADINAGSLAIFAGLGGDEAAQRIVGWGEVAVTSDHVFVNATANADRLIIASRGAGGSVDLKTMSIKEVPEGYPLGSAINVTENEAEKFTLVDGGANWLGEEFLTNGSFDTDSDWVKGTGWSISGGQAIQSGAPTSELLYQNVSRPAVYRIAVDVESISVDGIRFYDGAAYAYAVDQAGSYSFDVINKNTNYNFITIRSDVNTIANINSVSAKRLIPIAQTDPVVN